MKHKTNKVIQLTAALIWISSMLYNSCQKKGQLESGIDQDYQAIHDPENYIGELACMECHQN